MTDLDRLWPYELRQGNSNDPRHGACTMDAVSWFAYGRLGDRPQCASRALTSFVILCQDAMPHATRQRLKPYIFRLINSRDPDAEPTRVRCLVLAAARRFAPLALDAVRLRARAATLRALPDDATFAEIKVEAASAAAAASAEEAAWAASVSAEEAAAWAASAAATAAAASSASASAAASSASASAAASASASAASASRTWELWFQTLDEALSLGKQGSLDLDLDHVAARVSAFAEAARQ